MSNKNSLSNADWQQFGSDLIIYFFIPVLIVFLSSLQTGSLQLALGAAYGTALASAINLLGKFKSGIQSTPGTTITTQTTNVQTSPDVTKTPISPVISGSNVMGSNMPEPISSQVNV